MNSIIPYNPNDCHSDFLLTKRSKLVNFYKAERLNQENHQKSLSSKIINASQIVFKILFQVFECINHYACLLANGLISIKTKLLGVDLHLHLQLFTININNGSPNVQNFSPSSILTC
ncbi:hypothetical protein [Candidatus Protochlamydia amoebophila]|uniref:hypothetical protein n=1 Tax=Candidatus Protochlamydia amoebophila TaxID=362787 RepID=UPI001BC9AE2C|nr:hypothetical protein [Candidatus Protochlamydia amoebophila]